MLFHLYRIQVFFPEQKTLPFDEPISRQELLHSLVIGRPSAQLRSNQTWLIGDLEEIGDNSVYFRFGRVRQSKHDQYKDGRFITTVIEEHPNTHVFLDCDIEVCAIAQDTELAKYTSTVARNLVRLLSEQELAKKHGVELQINEVKDPETLLTYIRTAHSIQSFTFSVSKPNAWDVEQMFVKPAQQAVAHMGANQGVVSFKGDDNNELDRGHVESVVRTAAATGQEAKAKLKMDKKARPETKYLRGGDVSMSTNEIVSLEEKMSFMDSLRKKYRAILKRNGEDNGSEQE